MNPSKHNPFAAGGILAGIDESLIRAGAAKQADVSIPESLRRGILAGIDESLIRAGTAKQADVSIPESLRRGIMSGLTQEDMLKNQPGIKPGNGAVAQISGPGTGTSDSIPAKLGDTEFKVSNREGIAVLPEKTMRTPGAVEAVKHIIQQTNGLPPKLAIAKGIGFASGLVEEEKSKDMTAQLDAATKAAEPKAAQAAAPSTQLPSTGIAANPPGLGATSLTGFQSATRPIQPGETGVEMIGGIRHITPHSNPGGDAENSRAMTKGTNGMVSVSSPVATSGLYGAMLGAGTAFQQPPGTKGIANLADLERSNKSFALSQEIDKATGTGPGAGAAKKSGVSIPESLRRGILAGLDFGTMGKRFDAYQNNPDLLAKRNEREELLGSGLKMERGPNGITITGNGIAGNATIGDGASSINMAESNATLARANAARQSMIDSMARSSGGGSVAVIGESEGRDDLLKKILTPHAGAPNGQLTANQINAARGIMADVNAENLKVAEISQRGNEAERRIAKDAADAEGKNIHNQQSRFMLDLQQRAAAGDEQAVEAIQSLKGGQTGERLSLGQRRSNLEIMAAREAINGLSPAEIQRRTDKTTDTGRENPDFDPLLERAVSLGNRRMYGDDDAWFDSRQRNQPSKAAQQFSGADVQAAIKAGADPQKVAERIKSMGGNPAEYGL